MTVRFGGVRRLQTLYLEGKLKPIDSDKGGFDDRANFNDTFKFKLENGDKGYVVQKYLTERLKKTSPKILTEGTSGNSQSHLIAVRIVTKINTLIEEDVLTKRDGTPLKHQISEGELKDSDIIDPTKTQ